MTLVVLPGNGHEFAVSPNAVAVIEPGQGDTCTARLTYGGSQAIKLNAEAAVDTLGITPVSFDAPEGGPVAFYLVNPALLASVVPLTSTTCQIVAGGVSLTVEGTLVDCLKKAG